MKVICPQCHISFDAETGRVNRAAKIGAPLYCGRVCMGLARRLKNPLTDEQRRAAKSAYDAERRNGSKRAEILAKKRAYYYANWEQINEKFAEYRAAHMDRHVEYCRQPEYRTKKSEYDRRRRAEMNFGEFSEAALILSDIEREIEERSSKYEIYRNNGTLNKAQQRRRAL